MELHIHLVERVKLQIHLVERDGTTQTCGAGVLWHFLTHLQENNCSCHKLNKVNKDGNPWENRRDRERNRKDSEEQRFNRCLQKVPIIAQLSIDLAPPAGAELVNRRANSLLTSTMLCTDSALTWMEQVCFAYVVFIITKPSDKC